MEGFPAVGHGLGTDVGSTVADEGRPDGIEPNMYLAVELLLGHPSIGGASSSTTGSSTDDGFEVLTTARSRWW